MLIINNTINNVSTIQCENEMIHRGYFDGKRIKVTQTKWVDFVEESVMLGHDTVISYQKKKDGRISWGTWLPSNFPSFLLWDLKEVLGIEVPLYDEE
nr:MAG TPA: hypothetical protein [Caudoviricetes sp.]